MSEMIENEEYPPDAPLEAYLRIVEDYFHQDRLDAAMKVVDDAFALKGWPAGLWTAFYNELMCENDARLASKLRPVDDLLSIELMREAPATLFELLSTEAVAARGRVGETLAVDLKTPVLITVLLPDAPVQFIVGSYGYVSHKTDKEKICLPYSLLLDPDELADALTHEFTHVAVEELAGPNVPRWLNEGLATYASGELRLRHARFVVETAAKSGKMLRLSKIEQTFNDSDLSRDAPERVQAAYYLAASFVKSWADKAGLASIRQALQSIGEGMDPEHAIRIAAHTSLRDLEDEWHKELSRS